MKFKVEQEFDAPLEKVIKAREERYNLLPDLKKPDIIERKETGNQVHTKRKFKASGALPKSMKKFVPMDSMEFVDHSTWDGDSNEHRWKQVSVKFAKQIRWEGVTRYEGAGGKTKRVMTGEIKVKIPFVGDQLEKMMVSGFKKNFEKDYDTINKAMEMMG
ncbi:MAG: DUF2505 domain-containing protein [bacterium]